MKYVQSYTNVMKLLKVQRSRANQWLGVVQITYKVIEVV